MFNFIADSLMRCWMESNSFWVEFAFFIRSESPTFSVIFQYQPLEMHFSESWQLSGSYKARKKTHRYQNPETSVFESRMKCDRLTSYRYGRYTKFAFHFHHFLSFIWLWQATFNGYRSISRTLRSVQLFCVHLKTEQSPWNSIVSSKIKAHTKQETIVGNAMQW